MKEILRLIFKNAVSLKLYFLYGFFLASFFTPIGIWTGRKLGAIDRPENKKGRNKIHHFPVPRTGGVAMYSSFVILFLLIHKFTPKFIGLFIGVTIIFIGMSVDDKYNLSVLKKFSIQFLAAAIVIVAGIKFTSITNPFTKELINLGWGGIILTAIWIVGITNALNIIDGLDGLAAGIAAISSITLSFVAIYKGNISLALLLLGISGSLIAFLIYNFHPARIFLGDSGAELLGFLLASISVMGAYKTATFLTMAVPLLTLGIPITEVFTSIVRRLKKDTSPFHYDLGHMHYRLLRKGWSQRKIALFYYVITTTLSVAGLYIAFGVK